MLRNKQTTQITVCMITTIKRITVEYLGYLVHERNAEARQKNELYLEAQEWRKVKYGGRSDICFDMYLGIKTAMDAKSPTIKATARTLDAKLVYGGQDGIVIGIEQKIKGQWTTVAKSELDIKHLSEHFISDLILGAYDSTDSKE